LSRIIHARTTEIVNAVFTEIKSYGYDQPTRKLIAGVVITGGGSQLKHVKQLVEYLTGMDTRIGFPNEHLATLPSDHALNSPMYATAVGLLMKGLDSRDVEGFVSETAPESLETATEFSPAAAQAFWDEPSQPAAEVESLADAHTTEEVYAETAVESATDADPKSRAKGDFFKRWADGFLKLIDDNDLK
jgi:cell division protein FtsA